MHGKSLETGHGLLRCTWQCEVGCQTEEMWQSSSKRASAVTPSVRWVSTHVNGSPMMRWNSDDPLPSQWFGICYKPLRSRMELLYKNISQGGSVSCSLLWCRVHFLLPWTLCWDSSRMSRDMSWYNAPLIFSCKYELTGESGFVFAWVLIKVSAALGEKTSHK